ncbi:MAG: DUF4258 domain-containing protein [Armatimonadetes bacterium]|nr:DUF4258 domain-containing protein [Armatimonadota bacterium]
MADVWTRIQRLVVSHAVRVSDHGYQELSDDGLFVHELVGGAIDAVVVEEYPDFAKGPCVLVLQRDPEGGPVHVVWGIPRGHESPAVLVTAYRPDPTRWTSDWLRRSR